MWLCFSVFAQGKATSSTDALFPGVFRLVSMTCLCHTTNWMIPPCWDCWQSKKQKQVEERDTPNGSTAKSPFSVTLIWNKCEDMFTMQKEKTNAQQHLFVFGVLGTNHCKASFMIETFELKRILSHVLCSMLSEMKNGTWVCVKRDPSGSGFLLGTHATAKPAPLLGKIDEWRSSWSLHSIVPPRRPKTRSSPSSHITLVVG